MNKKVKRGKGRGKGKWKEGRGKKNKQNLTKQYKESQRDLEVDHFKVQK